ncbi:MAG: AMP-binding protein [Rickettsiales bacterium]|jgi:acetyl-CoA synthetase|nr:AMP-binding protein [Rickettsiales bacterium]
MLATKFLKKASFDSYEDYIQNGAPVVPENFNFAYDALDVIAADNPDAPALLWTNDEGLRRSFSFRDISDLSNAAANVLASRGIGRGDAVLLFLRRRWEYWIIMMALHKLGAVPIPSTSQLKAHDIKYRIDLAGARHIIAFDDGHVMNEIKEAGQIPTDVSTIVAAMDHAPRTFGRVHTDNSDIMILYFTSGTTGMPKMVAHDFTYPLGHISTALFWQQLGDEDLHFALSESGWAKCSWGKMYGQWLAGACVFVYDFSGKFPPSDLLRTLSDNGISSFCAPPTVYKMLIRENMDKYNLGAIKKADVAGEALNPEVFRIFKNLTGVKMREGFGQTETTIMLFSNQWIEPKPGSMGMPAAGWDVRLLDEHGRPVETGEVGEICVNIADGRPAGMMKEYYKNEKRTKEAFHGGFYHTGDVAYRDEDGYFWFVGRNDDLIKSSGYRISPFEVESVLLEHPSVKEVAVTGVPDAIRGMAVKATIVLNKFYHGTDVLVVQLQQHVKSRTAPYKYPRVIDFAETLPMTISGKIKRAVIRAMDSVDKKIGDLLKK